MSEIVAAANDTSYRKLSKKRVPTSSSVSSRIIAQSESLTRYEASKQHRINASERSKASNSTGSSSLVDSNNNSCLQSSTPERAADDHDCDRKQAKKKKSSTKKKKTKKPHSRGGNEFIREDPTLTCLTSQSLALKNGDQENTLNTSDQASYVEPEIESSPFPKSSYKEVGLSPDSEQNSERGEDGNQWQSIGCDLDTQQLSNTATSCDETLKPPGEWHPNNDCPHMQPSETNHLLLEAARRHSVLDTVGNHSTASESRNSVLEGPHSSVSVSSLDVPSVYVPSVSVPSVCLPALDVPSVSVPSVSVPSVSVPSVYVPSVYVPSVSVPSVSVPSVSVPSVSVSSLDVLSVSVPSVSLPALDVPSVSVPSVSVPSVSVPPVSVPSVSVPSVSLLALDVPSVFVPSASVSSVSVPSVSVPPASVPSVSVPSVSVPSVSFSSVSVPSVSVSSLDVSSLGAPTVSVPRASVPAVAVPLVAGLEKSSKDLQRQTCLLHRLTLVLKGEMEKSLKSITVTFQELHNRLNRRETELISELNAVTSQVSGVLCEQKTKGEHLKREIQQLVQSSDSGVAQLKSQIKEYVCKRKAYEDMCERHRFVFESTNILDEIDRFGEIVSLEATDNQLPVTLILSGSDSTKSTITPPETATPANTPTATADNNSETPTSRHLTQAWSLEENRPQEGALFSDGEHLRQDDRPPVEGQVQNSAGGVILQMEPKHHSKQRNSIEGALADTLAAVNEITSAKERSRLDLGKGEEVRRHSADDLNSKPSTNYPISSANLSYSSSVEINIVSLTKQQNLTKIKLTNFDLRHNAFRSKDITSPMDINSPKDVNSPNNMNSPKEVNLPKDVNSHKDLLVNRCPPLNGVKSSKQKSCDPETAGPVTSYEEKLLGGQLTHQPSEQPLRQASGDDGQGQFKRKNNSVGKCHLPAKLRLSDSSDESGNDGNRPPQIGSLSSKPTERKGSSPVKEAQMSDADNTKTECEASLSQSTESGENLEQTESVGSRNKKKRKKKKHSKEKSDSTIQDDSSSSVSDCSKNSAGTFEHKDAKQQIHLKGTVQNQANSAETGAVNVAKKRGITRKRKRGLAKIHNGDENSPILANIFTGFTNGTVLTTTQDKQEIVSQTFDTCLQKQKCAMTIIKSADKSALNKCGEFGDKNKDVAETSVDRNCGNKNADDNCKRKNIGPNLIRNLRKHDVQTLHRLGYSETTKKPEEELQNMEMKVNKRSSQNQNGRSFLAQEALSAGHNFISEDQQRI